MILELLTGWTIGVAIGLLILADWMQRKAVRIHGEPVR